METVQPHRISMVIIHQIMIRLLKMEILLDVVDPILGWYVLCAHVW